jgi:steroid 5-alpha reductase family enzyme
VREHSGNVADIVSDRDAHLTWLDGVAALVTLTAIGIEATADWQLRRVRHSLSAKRGALPAMPQGWWWWSLSRHPN